MLAHERRGSGPPLVLIHGLGSRRQAWDPLVAELSHHREIITVDLPGFGESALWPAPVPPAPAAGTAAPGRIGAPGHAAASDHPAAPDHQATPSQAASSGPSAAPGQTAASGHLGASGQRAEAGGAGAAGGPAYPARTRTPVPGSVDHLADLVAAFLDELGLERPELAGNSLGGAIALELGRRGRASAVTAFAPIGFWGPVGRRWCQTVVTAARGLSTALAPVLPQIFATKAGRVALCAVFFGHPARLSPADCLGSARALSRAPGFAAARRAFGVWRLPVGADPAALSEIPVTVVWGTRDVILPYRRQAGRARQELPGARHVVVAGCGHLPFADEPARCAELLTDRQ